MTDRPIIFSAPMIRALLDGRKTQTRRLLSIQGRRGFTEFGPSDTPGYDWHFRDARMLWHDLRHADLIARLPWAVGDFLWVQEAWNLFALSQDAEESWPVRSVPRADPRKDDDAVRGHYVVDYAATASDDGPWRPSIHMPRWASRLTLTVTDVRVQRLQEISEEDAQAEGVPPFVWVGRHLDAPHRYNFQLLWDELHGSGSWNANPHVVALTFTVAQRNIDA